ncbi:hypothetical protein CPB84DRAFT_1749463 [Gymnopilus junonius]|uniref:Uncharacterized protein n=1 Tax=Gymnopilus junonius TaxID=109634 RepID=A0A9P5TLA8_GYMJU|nr:hypothetical protein CPB84DRAFT_1749463 [Gymnopilus junonius]
MATNTPCLLACDINSTLDEPTGFTVTELLYLIAHLLSKRPPAPDPSLKPTTSMSQTIKMQMISHMHIYPLPFELKCIKIENTQINPKDFDWLAPSLDSYTICHSALTVTVIFGEVTDIGEQIYQSCLLLALKAISALVIFTIMTMWEEHYTTQGLSLQDTFNGNPNLQKILRRIFSLHLAEENNVAGDRSILLDYTLCDGETNDTGKISTTDIKMPSVAIHKEKDGETHNSFISDICSHKFGKTMKEISAKVKQDFGYTTGWHQGAIEMVGQFGSGKAILFSAKKVGTFCEQAQNPPMAFEPLCLPAGIGWPLGSGESYQYRGEWLIRSSSCSLKFVNGIRVFRKIGNSGGSSFPCLEFELGDNREGRWVSFNPQAGLVFKTYLDASRCQDEANIYVQLMECSFSSIPPFYGIYENKDTSTSGALLP